MPRKKNAPPADAFRRSFAQADHPPVEINLYRRTATGFGVVVTLLLLFVSFLFVGGATITVYAEDIVTPLEIRMRVQPSATMDNQIAGHSAETIVRANREGVRAAEVVMVPAEAGGVVIIFNNQPRPQTLVQKTRLLSREGVLFRLRDRVTIPARGQLEAVVYADEKGVRGNIGPTHFTIPGLREELQIFVYAESAQPMTGGEVSKSAITAEDIEKSYITLREQLEEQAREELGAKLELDENQHLFMQSEILEQSTNGKVGETGIYTVSISLHVIGVAVSDSEFFSKVKTVVLGLLPSYRRLGEISYADIGVMIDAYTILTNEADLKLFVQARTRQTVNTPELAKKHFFLLSKEMVGSYLDRLEGIEKYEVKMPFYMRKTPKNSARLKIIVK